MVTMEATIAVLTQGLIVHTTIKHTEKPAVASIIVQSTTKPIKMAYAIIKNSMFFWQKPGKEEPGV